MAVDENEAKAEEQAAPEVDLLGDPVVEEQAAPTVEERLAALEELQNGRSMKTVCQAVDAISRALAELSEFTRGEFGPSTLEARLAALEAKIESPFDPAELEGRLYEMEGRYAALEAKLERIATTAARSVHPRTLDELPSPYAPESATGA